MSQSISTPGTIAAPQRKPVSKLRFILPLGVVLAAGGAAWYFGSRPPANSLQFSGRIEGYESDVGTKVAGRVESVAVREGATVKQGQLLVKLDDDELRAQLKGAEAQLKAAKQQQENARLQVSVLTSELNEAELKVQQSQGDTAGRISQAGAQVAAAEAQLQQARAQVIEAEAQLELARTDRDRYAQLSQDGAASQQRFQQADTTYKTAQATLASRRATVEAFQRQVTAAQGQLTQTQSTSLNPEISAAQRDRFTTQLEQSQVQLTAAQAEVASAEASRQQILAQLNNLTVTSPISGVVTTRSVEPGVVVSSGRTLLSVLDLNTVYLRGFIPAGDIGKVRVGQTAQVFLDSSPNRPFTAKVAAIDSEASFTPENIYFKQDRVQQVFGVRLTLEQPAGLAKPGMPADATIVFEDETP
jgi:HlyD family secretion protein